MLLFLRAWISTFWKCRKQVITEGTKHSWFFSFTLLGWVFAQLTVHHMSFNVSLILWCENCWALMLVCANLADFIGPQQHQSIWSSRGGTFKWKGLTRTLRQSWDHTISSKLPTTQATLSSTTPSLHSHQGLRCGCALKSTGWKHLFTWYPSGIEMMVHWTHFSAPSESQHCHCSSSSLFLFFYLLTIYCFTIIFKDRALWLEMREEEHTSQLPKPKKHTGSSWGPVCLPSPAQNPGMAVGGFLL